MFKPLVILYIKDVCFELIKIFLKVNNKIYELNKFAQHQ